MKNKKLISSIITLFLICIPVSFANASTYSEKSNHKTVSIKIGSSNKIVLHTTYWQLSSVKGNAIKIVGQPEVQPIMPGPTAPANCQVPGTGCGIVSTTFVAKSAGISVITFLRNSCGEVLKCTPAQRVYQIKVKVTK